MHSQPERSCRKSLKFCDNRTEAGFAPLSPSQNIRCKTISFCDMFCSCDSGMILDGYPLHSGNPNMLWFRFDFAESLPKPFVIQELCEPWPVKVFPCFRAFFVFCFHIHKFSGSPMARRTNKTAKRKRSGQQSRTGIQGHTVKPRRPPFWKRIPKPIYAVLGIAALAVTLLEGYPWLSIQEGSLTDPGNPFSEMFKVVNGGYVPVTNLDAVCLLGGEQPGRVYISPGAYKIIQTGFANYLEHDKAATIPVSYTHLRAHETDSYLVCRLLLEKKK